MTTVDPGDDEPVPSLADRRRAFVAREIEQAAIGVLATHGYENVTVADIAAAAGISRRTFFRYFGSKDHVLRAHDIRLQARVVRALRRRPADEPAAIALCEAFLDTAEIRPEEQDFVRLRNRVLHETQWRAGFAALPADLRVEVVDLVATRMRTDPGVDVRPHLVVTTIWVAAGTTSAHWASSESDESLTAAMHRSFEILLEGLGALDGDTAVLAPR